MVLASWEGSIRGHWPLEEYMKLTEVRGDDCGTSSGMWHEAGLRRWGNTDRVRPACSWVERFGSSTPSGDSLLYPTRVVDPNFVRCSPSAPLRNG